jgi:hypothetical protein
MARLLFVFIRVISAPSAISCRNCWRPILTFALNAPDHADFAVLILIGCASSFSHGMSAGVVQSI